MAFELVFGTMGVTGSGASVVGVIYHDGGDITLCFVIIIAENFVRYIEFVLVCIA